MGELSKLQHMPYGPYSQYYYHKHVDKFTEILIEHLFKNDWHDILDDLKIKDLDINFCHMSDNVPVNTDAYVLAYIKQATNGKLKMTTDNKITIIIFNLVSKVRDLMQVIDNDNEELLSMLIKIKFENDLIHELRHRHQFKHWFKTVDNDVVTEADGKYLINNKTRIKLENDANDYMLSKIEYTHCGDKELKRIMTDMDHFLSLDGIIRNFMDDDDSETLELCKKGILSTVTRMKKYTDEHYPSK